MPDKDTVFPYDDEVADPYAADDTKNPHEATGDDDTADDDADDEADETDTPPKRRPGRPRKTAS